ncbi:hypothetical protein RCOM_1715180 [Ricinus communis]|uniref:peptide-methionine (R)-S-oxide reductase n=1 Tax=Ricinus communis TaxID=3988 RepID=B9SU46_RICCO|nr:hypothetical protein RCOM_1715180 [Ricinus communis]
MAVRIGHTISLPTTTTTRKTFVSSKTQFQSLPFSSFGLPKRVSFSVRAMGSSASSQRPDNIQEAGKVNYASVSDDEWKKRLSAEQFYITRQKGTERAFTGVLKAADDPSQP